MAYLVTISRSVTGERRFPWNITPVGFSGGFIIGVLPLRCALAALPKAPALSPLTKGASGRSPPGRKGTEKGSGLIPGSQERPGGVRVACSGPRRCDTQVPSLPHPRCPSVIRGTEGKPTAVPEAKAHLAKITISKSPFVSIIICPTGVRISSAALAFDFCGRIPPRLPPEKTPSHSLPRGPAPQGGWKRMDACLRTRWPANGDWILLTTLRTEFHRCFMGMKDCKALRTKARAQ